MKDYQKTKKAFDDIVKYISLDKDMEKILKGINFKQIYKDISLKLPLSGSIQGFESTFTTHTSLLKFNHPYITMFENDNIMISFSRRNKDYRLTFFTDNYDKYFDKKIRESKNGTLGIDNTIFKMDCRIKNAKLDELSRQTKRIYISHFKNYVVVENMEYVSVMDVIRNQPYNHPVYRTENTIKLETEKQK